MWRPDGNDPFDARQPALANVRPRDQAPHAVTHEQDAGRAGGGAYGFDLCTELLGEVFDVAAGGTIVDRVHRTYIVPRKKAPHREPHAVVDHHAMYQNNGQTRGSRG